MSLFNRRWMICAPLAMAGCGFTPVYSTKGSGKALQNGIEISEPESRDAFLLTQRLEERLGRATTPDFKLTVTVVSDDEDIAVDREGTVTRFNLIGRSDYVLVEQDTGRVVTSGTVTNFTSYSATGTTVSELAAERDAQERLMTLLADQIVVRLLSTDLT